jgi:hypothetical protein
MSDEMAVRALRGRLERGETTAAEAVATLAVWAVEAPTRATRLDACQRLGDLAGRALGAEWEHAERAAFALLEAARLADTAADRRGLIAAMGRGFRNLWLLPFVHRRLSDRDPTVAAAARSVRSAPATTRCSRTWSRSPDRGQLSCTNAWCIS